MQFGNNNYHFRGNSWDLFVQDEWRLRGNLTLNLGVRYEYFSPFSEENNRIVNLDLPVGFTSPPVPVQVGQTGPYNGAFPVTLVRPDRNNFAPRLGLAWKPLRNTVVRAGYGINYNTSAYQSIVQNMAFQPPFSTTATNTQSATTVLTLQNGFPAVPPGSITNNFGVDPNYRLGYVQIWNVDVQQQIRPTLIMNLDYTGTKGTRLDILEAPNRTATGVLFPGVQPFYWEDSLGDSTANALVPSGSGSGCRRAFQLEAATRFRSRWTTLPPSGAASRWWHKAPDAPEFPAPPTSRKMHSTWRLSEDCPASINATISPLTICGSFPSAMSGGGCRAKLRCGPSWETGIGAATGPSLRDCPSLPGFWATY